MFQACTWAKHLCVEAGVKFILGEPQGKLKHLVKNTETGKVTGIVTSDDKEYYSDLVVLAC